MKAAVVTVSDGVSAGEREDESGALLVELLEAERYDVEHRVVPDERPQIAAALRELAQTAQLVLTTGGTGLSPRDFTPEATESVLDRRVRASPRRCAPTRSARRRTVCSAAVSPASAGKR